jgi:hypothetical protein
MCVVSVIQVFDTLAGFFNQHRFGIHKIRVGFVTGKVVEQCFLGKSVFNRKLLIHIVFVGSHNIKQADILV